MNQPLTDSGQSERGSELRTLRGFDVAIKQHKQHICVCVCTYKRPDFLERLLLELVAQETANSFVYSIVVADNDERESARNVVSRFAAESVIPFRYCVEPRQNIALARNKAVENAEGDFVAFIDDDEFPARNWLLSLFQTCERHRVDGVLGPVKRHFDQKPPNWVIKGKFYERPSYRTGSVIDWKKGRTNNVLVRKKVFAECEQPFRPEFRSGEDQDFFRRVIDQGHIFIWCNEAVAYEVVPPIRWKRKFMLKRALLQGACAQLHPNRGAIEIVKSALAILLCTTVLPFALLMGQHWLMRISISLFWHVGTLLGVLRVDPIKNAYVTE